MEYLIFRLQLTRYLKSEFRNQKSGFRNQKPEIGNQNSEVGFFWESEIKKSEIKNWVSEFKSWRDLLVANSSLFEMQ